MQSRFRAYILLGAILFSSSALAQVNSQDVQRGGQAFKNNPQVLSPPVLQRPIYECAQTVVINGYVPNAKIQIFVAGNPTPVGRAVATETSGQPIQISIPFTLGQTVIAVQSFDEVDSKPSNAVTVTSHMGDYPNGLPQPRIEPAPCYECGRTVGVADVIPGAWWKVFAEDPMEGGGFSVPVEVGASADSSHTLLNSPFKKGQRITVQSGICSKKSDISRPEIVLPQPGVLSPPILANTVYEGGDVVVATGPGGRPLTNGAYVGLFTGNRTPNSNHEKNLPATGGAQQIRVKPMFKGRNYWATQALCTPSRPGPKRTVQPCTQLPPAKIRQPLPGDAIVDVIDFVPGSRITIYSGKEEIGDGSGPKLALTRPVSDAEKITVIQAVGSCVGDLVSQVTVGCSDRDAKACSSEWPAFRHSGLRDGHQPFSSPLADPEKVKTLKVKWKFTPPPEVVESEFRAFGFRASAIVHKGRVYIGNANGRLYALNAATGELLWRFPKTTDSPLTSSWVFRKHNPSSEGLPASASIGTVKGQDAVIFGAPDPSIGKKFGSGVLFALDPASGSLLWRSPEIAVIDGTSPNPERSELHENIGYSSPLVLGNRTFVGIANHADNPIQNGRIVAVDTDTGAIVDTFSFKSTSTRGGGIWSSLAGGLDKNAIFATTGNARTWASCRVPKQQEARRSVSCQAQPQIDHSLSLLRLNAETGAVEWKLKPVPFELDDDPDWASGPTILTSRCGHVVASTQKDGWTYAVGAGPALRPGPSVRWQFPPTGIPFKSGTHGDSRYIFPGAGWNDTFITTMGGYSVEMGQVRPGMTRLHALDVCADRFKPVRWIADIPGTTQGNEYQLGPPTVTRGIVFVGTAQGDLVALADPSVWPASGSVCSIPEVSNADCASNGLPLVPRPTILAQICLEQLDNVCLEKKAGSVRTEPVLADGRVFVATSDGTFGALYMLEPDK